MSSELIISGNRVKIIEWKGHRVLTTQEMALHHNLPLRILNQKFRRNQKYFKENIDYFIVTKEMVTNCDHVYDDYFYHDSDLLYLFTESGYLNFVKTINDDKAWEIYNQLVEAYFQIKRLNQAEKQYLEKSKENRKGLTGEWQDHNAKDYKLLTISEYESIFNDGSKRKKNMDDKELSLLSVFEFLESRKLENNPEIQGDNKLCESLLDTGNKINSIIENKKLIK